jgi:hypothetical protein
MVYGNLQSSLNTSIHNFITTTYNLHAMTVEKSGSSTSSTFRNKQVGRVPGVGKPPRDKDKQHYASFGLSAFEVQARST